MLIPPEFAPNFKPSVTQSVTVTSSIRRNVPIPMQDGIRLATDLYFPPEPGRYPVLLERTPYGKHQSVMVSIGAPEFLAANGYVVAVQDARGRFADLASLLHSFQGNHSDAAAPSGADLHSAQFAELSNVAHQHFDHHLWG